MEVEDEEQLALLRRDHLVALVLQAHVLVRLAEEWEGLLQAVHRRVEVVEVDVPQVGLVGQGPLAAGAVVRPVVADAREVDPLGVAELIAHEVEVALAAESHSHHADALVQRDAAVDDEVGRGEERHAVVHLLIHEPEGNGLVAHQRLVVRLAVAHHLLLVPAVGEGVGDVAHLPLVIRLLLEQLDPHVGRRHGQAVVEPEPALGHGAAQSGHARHVLRDGNGARAHPVDHVVGEHKVDAGVHVGAQPEVLAVAVYEGVLDAVVLVEDTRHAVEAEAVELVLLEPPAKVGKQEAQHLPLAVVEDAAVPQVVVALRPLVEVLVRRPVEPVDAVHHVLGRMRVDDVKKHADAHAVGRVDEALERVGVAAARGGGEEVSHVVAE
mmetsp:Transcript_9850/g.28314  ORF Transcript_9850/g.28314 Transcript_9850/m.28314 type:complete len:381 (+) Transcript_9850:270-1412(+)